ncbi:MAG: amphi-Trp domain-containing protein [Longimicrobiales bacterium]
MGTSRNGEFAHESLQDTESIGKYLEALAQGFRAGRLEFASGSKQIELEPNSLLELAVRAKRKDGTARISVEVQWKVERTRKTRQTPLKIKVPKERG